MPLPKIAMSSRYEEGDPNSPICIVGEAPSYMEVRDERPFVGPAGQLMERCLHAAGISRHDCYIVNVFEDTVVKPKEKNEIFDHQGNFLWSGSKGFSDRGKEMTRRSLARLRNSHANVIIPMGGTALHLCTREFNDGVETKAEIRSISKWRGSIFYGIDGRKLVPTFHPSSCLRGSYENRYYIISDLRKAKEEAATPLFIPTKRRLIIDPSYEDCISFLKRCWESDRFNTDIEVLGGQMDCFSLSIEPNEAISITLVDPDFQPRFSVDEECRILEWYARLLGSERHEKVNQNILFDLATLLRLNKIIPRGPMSDPMVAFSVMYPFLEKGLGVICSMMTREPYYKDDGTLTDSPTVKDFARRWEYNAKDSAISLECWLKLEPMLVTDGYVPTYNIHMGEMSALIYMMTVGTLIDETALAEAGVEARKLLAEIVGKISEAMQRNVITAAPKKAAEKREAAANNVININSSQQMCDYFYVDKRIRPYTNPGGNRTIDDKALAQIVRRYGLPEAKLLQEYRAQSKLLGTYLEMGYDPDKRLRCSYNIRGTWTGRLSSSKTIFGTGGNMQNIPPDMRGFLVSDEARE